MGNFVFLHNTKFPYHGGIGSDEDFGGFKNILQNTKFPYHRGTQKMYWMKILEGLKKMIENLSMLLSYSKCIDDKD